MKAYGGLRRRGRCLERASTSLTRHRGSLHNSTPSVSLSFQFYSRGGGSGGIEGNERARERERERERGSKGTMETRGDQRRYAGAGGIQREPEKMRRGPGAGTATATVTEAVFDSSEGFSNKVPSMVGYRIIIVIHLKLSSRSSAAEKSIPEVPWFFRPAA